MIPSSRTKAGYNAEDMRLVSPERLPGLANCPGNSSESGNPMKRLIIAICGYALYRWLTKPEQQPVEVAGSLPRNRPAPRRKPAAS